MKEREKVQLLFSCEHASPSVPNHLKKNLNVPEAVLRSHRGFDRHALDFAQNLAQQLRVPLYSGKWTRLLIDLNRSLGQPGLWSKYSDCFNKSEKAEIVAKYYQPFRKDVKQAINSLKPCKIRPVLHLSIHSFTPQLRGERRDFHLGLLFDPKHDFEKEMANTLRRNLLKDYPRLKIVFNKPYKGTDDGHTTQLRGLFSTYYAGIEIELRQNLAKNQRERILDSLAKTLSERLF